MSDEGTAVAAPEAPSAAPVAPVTPAAPAAPAAPQNAAEYRAQMRESRSADREVPSERPRDASGKFVAADAPTTEAAAPEKAATETTATTEAAAAPPAERIELHPEHPLRAKGRTYVDELSPDELRGLANTAIRARQVEEARAEITRLNAELARAKAASEGWQQQTASILQNPEIAAKYAEIKAWDEQAAEEWLRGYGPAR